MSSQFFNVSREEDSTASQGNLLQCLVALTGKLFLMFRGNLLVSFVPVASGPVTVHQ